MLIIELAVVSVLQDPAHLGDRGREQSRRLAAAEQSHCSVRHRSLTKQPCLVEKGLSVHALIAAACVGCFV